MKKFSIQDICESVREQAIVRMAEAFYLRDGGQPSKDIALLDVDTLIKKLNSLREELSHIYDSMETADRARRMKDAEDEYASTESPDDESWFGKNSGAAEENAEISLDEWAPEFQNRKSKESAASNEDSDDGDDDASDDADEDDYEDFSPVERPVVNSLSQYSTGEDVPLPKELEQLRREMDDDHKSKEEDELKVIKSQDD